MKDHRIAAAPIIHKLISPAIIWLLVALFLVGLCVSTFTLIVIHSTVFFTLRLYISTLIAVFLRWNSRNAAISGFLYSFPDSNLTTSTHGQLVKITGGTMDILKKYPIPECDIWFIKFSCDFHYRTVAVGNRKDICMASAI